jgi:hypothetical protein
MAYTTSQTGTTRVIKFTQHRFTMIGYELLCVSSTADDGETKTPRKEK